MVLDQYEVYFQVGFPRMSKLINLDKILHKRSIFNSTILGFLALFYVLWGTGWSVPIVNISLPGIWYIVILFLIISQYKYTNIFNNPTGLIILMIIFLLLVYSLLALPQIFTSNDYMRDLKYLVSYDIKFIISVGSIFVFYKFISSNEDLEFTIKIASIALIFLTIFLHWKYFYIYNLAYIGVEIGEVGSRSGKNSIATACAIFSPFLISLITSPLTNRWNKVFGLLALISIIFITVNILSRSMTVLIIVGFFSYIFFIRIKKKYKLLIAFSTVLSLLLLFSTINVSDYVYKQGAFKEKELLAKELNYKPYSKYNETSGGMFQKYQNSHRGWLISESISGFKDSYFMGNGVSTFRIRGSNNGSRTETHNDYAMLIYEQGIFGFFALLLLLFYRFIRTKRVIKYNPNNPYIVASLSSLIVLAFSMLFINLYSTQIFWVIISLNYVIVENLCEKERLLS